MRVDHANRFGPQLRVLGGRVAHGPNFAIGALDAAVQRHLAHLGHAPTVMRHRLCPWQGLAHRVGHASDDLTLKRAFEPAIVGEAHFADQTLRREIAAGSIVLVYSMHRHAIRRRCGRLGQRGSKGILSLVGDADPVHCTDRDRLPCPQQHDAPAAQRHLIDPFHRVIGHRRSHRRRGVHVESCQAQPTGRRLRAALGLRGRGHRLRPTQRSGRLGLGKHSRTQEHNGHTHGKSPDR